MLRGCCDSWVFTHHNRIFWCYLVMKLFILLTQGFKRTSSSVWKPTFELKSILCHLWWSSLAVLECMNWVVLQWQRCSFLVRLLKLNMIMSFLWCRPFYFVRDKTFKKYLKIIPTGFCGCIYSGKLLITLCTTILCMLILIHEFLCSVTSVVSDSLQI